MSAADLIRFRAARAEDCVQILRGNRIAAFISCESVPHRGSNGSLASVDKARESLGTPSQRERSRGGISGLGVLSGVKRR
jgi:hypothetical protein